MKQPFKAAWAVVPETASIIKIGKHSRTTEGVGRKEKSTINLATITIAAKQLYHTPFLCVKETYQR